MKNLEVIYQNGQLILAQNKNQIHLVPGKKYYINGDDDAFLEHGYMEEKNNIRNEKEMLAYINTQYGNFTCERILQAGTKLYFRIGLGRKTLEDKTNEYLFDAILLEDLYIRSQQGTTWRLCECICKTGEYRDNKLPFTHTITGNSLSNLFSNVVTHYFSYKRATTCNAFNTFALASEVGNVNLNWIKRKDTVFIENIRNDVVRHFNEKMN